LFVFVTHFLNKDVKIDAKLIKNFLMKLSLGKNIIIIDIIPI
jgi:hypothetical protein